MTDKTIFNVPIIRIGRYAKYRLDVKDLSISGHEQTSSLDEHLSDEQSVSEFVHIASPIQSMLSSNEVIKIQTDLNCRIRKNEYTAYQSSHILVARNPTDLASATTRMHLAIRKAKQRIPFTHFIAVKLSDLSPSLINFTTDVMSKFKYDECLFQNPKRFHLTLLTLTLLDDIEVRKAKELAKKSILAFHNDGLLKNGFVNIKNLEIMNDDPQCVDVLYAKVSTDECSKSLINLTRHIIDLMDDANLRVEDHSIGRSSVVKLHATVMNSKFRKNKSKSPDCLDNTEQNNRTPIDVQPILNDFSGVEFGAVSVMENMHLCWRKSFNPTTGFYKSESLFSM